jgi:L-asparaginase
MQTVYVITTGGTIEKVYQENTGSVENLENKIARYLRLLRLPDLRVETSNLMNKDSLEMTAADRELILEAVKHKLQKPAPLVITHGTDTMVRAGLLLQRRLPHLKVPIILTGAMTPLGFEGSDGLQNLTESLFAARILKPGVYLVMHSQVFPIDRVRKSKKLSRFVWKRGEGGPLVGAPEKQSKGMMHHFAVTLPMAAKSPKKRARGRPGIVRSGA